MQFVRQSKFRHVFCKPLKHEFCLNDVRITKITWDSLFCAVNPKFIAVITEGSGGPFMVIPVSKVGRVEKDYPVVDAHKGPCLELAWCPFNDNVIASCSEDTSAKVWHIPDNGLRRNLTEPIVELLGHQKRVSSLQWHPSANNVLLTAGADLKILLWNVGAGEALIEIAGHPDQIWSVAFNYNGSKIVTTCKDKKVRVIDPRTGRILQQGNGHEGVKPQRAIFIKDGRILTTGFTKRSERMYALRDEEALDEPIVQEELDTSNGVLYPVTDNDTGLVYLCGKGDSNIRYYEVNNDPPFVHWINTYTTSEPQRGIGFMPKRGLNIHENEISRVYKFTNKGLVEVLQFFVPRKSDLFQDDLYPDTACTTPAMTAEEWINGKDADPVLMPLAAPSGTGAGGSKPTAKVGKKANILAQMPAPQEPQAPARSPQPKAEPPKAAKVEKETPKTLVNPDPDIVQFRKSPAVVEREPVRPREEPHHEEPPSQPRYRRTAEATNGRPNREDVVVPRLSETGSRSVRSRQSAFEEPAASNPNPMASSYPNRMSSAPSTPARSNTGVVGEVTILEELYADVQKLKAIIRSQDRRIRFLEMQLAERQMVELDTL